MKPNLHVMKLWTCSAGWHVVHGRLVQCYARLTSRSQLYAQGKEEEMLGRLQHNLDLNEEKTLALLRRNHGHWHG